MAKYTLIFILLSFSISLLGVTKTKLDNVIWQDYKSNKWVNTEMDSYTYNSQGLKSLNITHTWNNETEQWTPQQEIQYKYNANQLIELVLIRTFNATNQVWSDSSQTSYLYNNQQMSEMSIQHKILEEWLNQIREVYSSTENSEETISYTWDTQNNKWVESIKETYTYTDYSDLEQYTSYVWDELTEIWIPFEKETYEYSSNEITNYTYQKWDDFKNEWVNNFKDYTETYIEDGSPKLRYLSYNWNNNKQSWDYYTREFHTFSSADKLLTYEEDTYNSMRRQWDYYDQEVYEYDAQNNLITYIDKDKERTFNRWVNNTKEEMEYTSTIKKEDLIIPFSGSELDLYFNSQLNQIELSEWNSSKAKWALYQKAVFSYSQAEITVSNESLSNHDLHIYPNPANDYITINGSKTGIKYDVKIYSAQGNIVQQNVAESNQQIKLHKLPRGFYTISITNNGEPKLISKFINK